MNTSNKTTVISVLWLNSKCSSKNFCCFIKKGNFNIDYLMTKIIKYVDSGDLLIQPPIAVKMCLLRKIETKKIIFKKQVNIQIYIYPMTNLITTKVKQP